MLIVTSVGTDARTRAALRTTMHHKRFGELREGVWMRPDNLDLDLDPEVAARVRVLKARDEAPAELAGQLWDLPAWAETGHRLLDEMADPATDVPGRFVVAAAMVRHLLTDPVLPAELLPADWPGAAAARRLPRLRHRTGRATRTDPTRGGDMSDPVRVERNGPVTTVILNRPAARNAVNGPTAAALYAAFEEFDRDDTASVAVLWGDGGTFCAGADLKAFGTPEANAVHRTGPGPMGPTRMVLSKPVIAAVSGYAVAGRPGAGRLV